MKKNIPIPIIEAVEPLLKTSLKYIAVKHSDICYYEIYDKDENSDYHFYIYKESEINDDKISVNFCPINEEKLGSLGYPVDSLDELKHLLESWLIILEKYNSIVSIFDDPIIETYQKEYYQEYKIVDEEADYTPFEEKQLFLLDEYLERVAENIDKFKTEKNATIIDEIKLDAQDLRNELTSLSKNAVMKKLSIIWAKMKKQGLPLVKEFISTAKTEVFKYLAKAGIEAIL